MLRTTTALALLLAACEPQTPAAAPEATTAAASVPVAVVGRPSSCHEDIPDCAAACALRETGRTEHLDWFDRRCAAVVLGKNPDRAVPPPASSATATGDDQTRHDLQTTPYDPFTAKRDGMPDPPECRAALELRARGQPREANVLAAMCFAKGGGAGALGPADAGAAKMPPDTRR